MNTAVPDPTSPSSSRGGGAPLPQWHRSPGDVHLRLTHAERDAAAEHIRVAYTDGKLDETELEERLDLAMGAKVRADLEPLLADIVQPAAAVSVSVSASAPARTAEPRPDGRERVLAAAGHVSGYFFSALGPLFVLLLDGRTSAFVRRHAIEALNYQLTFVVGSIVLLCLSWLILPLVAWLLMLLGWTFLPALAGLVAVTGARWKYPVTWRPVKNH